MATSSLIADPAARRANAMLAVWTDTAGSTEPLELSHRYIEELASALGAEVEKSKNGGKWYVAIHRKAPQVDQIMERFNRWAEVARAHIARLHTRDTE